MRTILTNACKNNFHRVTGSHQELCHLGALRRDLQLKNGWFAGSGLAPDADRLSSVSEKIIADYPDKLPSPIIVSKQDGNILLEWKVEGDPSLDIDLTNLQASYHAFGADEEDVERDFNLDPVGWQSLFAFLNDTIKVQQA
ncbi:hypothetical protein NDY24_04155 [Xanthomonas hortorum pv. pelargonii]|nr:hypothetical protein NDY24_04155 [Xanthomonas hortorum pv. pelargonii]